jgi:acetyltransferase
MQLLAAARLLALRKRPAGPRLAIVANGGGPGVLAADAVARQPLELARLSDATVAALDAALPAYGSHRNPVDLTADVDPAAHRVVAAHGARRPRRRRGARGVHAAVPSTPSPTAAARAIVACRVPASPKPGRRGVRRRRVGGGRPAAARRGRHPAVPDARERGRRARAAAELRAQPAEAAAGAGRDRRGLRADVAAAEAMYRKVLAEGRTLLDEVESKALLAHFGIGAPPSIVAADPQAAAQAAERIGFPVV